MFVIFSANLKDSNQCKLRLWLEVLGDLLIVGVYVSDVELVGP